MLIIFLATALWHGLEKPRTWEASFCGVSFEHWRTVTFHEDLPNITIWSFSLEMPWDFLHWQYELSHLAMALKLKPHVGRYRPVNTVQTWHPSLINESEEKHMLPEYYKGSKTVGRLPCLAEKWMKSVSSSLPTDFYDEAASIKSLCIVVWETYNSNKSIYFLQVGIWCIIIFEGGDNNPFSLTIFTYVPLIQILCICNIEEILLCLGKEQLS